MIIVHIMYHLTFREKCIGFLQVVLGLGCAGLIIAYASTAERSTTTMPSAGIPAVNTTAPEQHKAPQTTATTEDRSDNYHRVTVWNKEKAAPGFTIYPVSGTEEILLLSMDGKIVHRWSMDAERARLLPNCNLLVIHGSKWGKAQERWRKQRHYLREYDWEGKVIWEYAADELVHHDAHKLDSGNYLFLKRATIPYPDEWIPSGSDPDNFEVRSDTVMEVSPDKKIIWSWSIHDSFQLHECGWRGCKFSREAGNKGLKAPDKIADWSHTNTANVVPENKWYDGGDQRFKPGNIIVLPRSFWTVYIIDRETRAPVWSFHGHPTEETPEAGLIRGHEAYMIPRGLPGAGNILLFDNGLGKIRKYSRILEVNPLTNQIVWSYEKPGEFFSDGAGLAQRLINGNTLISEDKDGRVFEITPEGELVWEVQGEYRVSRAERYMPGFCRRLPSR